MVSKHTKSCSSSSVIRKLQNESTMRYYPHSYWNASNLRLFIPSVKDMGQLECSYIAHGNVTLNHFGKQFDSFLKCYTDVCHVCQTSHSPSLLPKRNESTCSYVAAAFVIAKPESKHQQLVNGQILVYCDVSMRWTASW